MQCFSQEILSWTLGGPLVRLVCSFIRRDNLLGWRELSTNLYELNPCVWFWEKTSTLSEFIGYVDLKDCREISPENFRDNDKLKCVGKFRYFNFFFSVASIYATRLA